MKNKEALLNSGQLIYKTFAVGVKSPQERIIGKSFAGEKKTIFKKESRSGGPSYSFVGTKEMKDRDGDIVMLDGIDFSHYSKNPVVLWGHDSRSTPIGKSNSVVLDKEAKEAIFDIEFASTAKAREIETLVEEEVLNAVSIGFIVKDWEFDEQLDAFKFTEIELLEISIVNVPANPGALSSIKEAKETKSLSADDVSAMIADALAKLKPNEPAIEEEEVPADTVELPDEPIVEEGADAPKEPKEPVVEPIMAPAEDLVEEPNALDTVTNLLRDLLEAVRPQDNTEPDSREQENEPKESEPISQQPDVTPSDDINMDEDHSEESPKDNTEEESDNVNLVNVEDLDEETEFSVII